MQQLAGKTFDPVTPPPVPGSRATCQSHLPTPPQPTQASVDRTGQEAALGVGKASGLGGLMDYVILPEHGDPSTVLTFQALISPFSNDFTNKQMKQKLLTVKKYCWLRVAFCVSPVQPPVLDTAPWGQGGSPRAAHHQSSRRGQALCRCVLRLLPAGWTSEGDLSLCLLPARSWQPRQGLCCHLVVRLESQVVI